MLCQHCQKHTANVHFTQVVNGKKIEMYLCDDCAREKGKLGLGSPFSINDFFSGFIGFADASPYVTSVPQQEVCKKCGMSYEEFQRSGKLGCSNCYELFGGKLEPLLKRLHGSVEHHGKLPNRISDTLKASIEIEDLKKQLTEAIHKEQYEKAAEIRDMIRSVESGNAGKSVGPT